MNIIYGAILFGMIGVGIMFLVEAYMGEDE